MDADSQAASASADDCHAARDQEECQQECWEAEVELAEVAVVGLAPCLADATQTLAFPLALELALKVKIRASRRQ